MIRQTLFFLIPIVVVLASVILLADRLLPFLYPELSSRGLTKVESIALDDIAKSQNELYKRNHTAKDAKSDRLFWAANIEGKGLALNMITNPRLLDSLFPGYGYLLSTDKIFWSEYFKTEFGPNGIIWFDSGLAKQELRVAYSWLGCLDLYEKYGADVLVFGSSEVYMGLIPELLAKNTTKLFSKSPKVLFCATPAMTSKEVFYTAKELLQKNTSKPQIIIWGYSFWSAYTNSSKLYEYKKNKAKEIDEYLHRKKQEKNHTVLIDIVSMSKYKAADFFPKIDWNDVLEFTYDKSRLRSVGMAGARGDAEGIYVAKENFYKNDLRLSIYLKTVLKPYYAITQGATTKDCDMTGAHLEFLDALSELKKLSKNIYVYLTPTTIHQRETVPTCFLPNVKAMLKNSAKKEGINLLVADPESLGLDNGDFMHPTLNPDMFYFDINHTNYLGAKKMTDIIAGWVKLR